MKRSYLKKLLVSSVILFITSGTAFAIPIFGNSGIEGLGSFTGDFTFSATNDINATISMSLTNTSPVANGGYLTAFAFVVPLDSFSISSFSSTSASFVSLVGPIDAQPYPSFDLGASSTPGVKPWQAGGNPTGGIGVGQTVSFTFGLTGSGFDGLNEQSFFNAGDPWFAARFRGFEDGGSDKVPGSPVPEPATMLLLGSGLLGLAGFRKKFRKS